MLQQQALMYFTGTWYDKSTQIIWGGIKKFMNDVTVGLQKYSKKYSIQIRTKL